MNVRTWIMGYLKKYQVKFFIAFFLVLSASAISMVNPYISGIIVDKVITGGQRNLLLLLLSIMVSVTVIKSIIRYFFQMIFEYVSQNIVLKIREDMYTILQKLDFAFFDKTRTGEIMARIVEDTGMVRHFIAWDLYMVFENATLFIFAIIVLFTVNITFALILLVIAPVIAFLAYKLAFEVKPAFTATREQLSKLNTVVQENISGNRVVKAFAKEDHEVDKFNRENIAYKTKTLNVIKIWEKYLPWIESLAGLLSVIIILAGGILVINKMLTLGELVIFSSFIWALYGPMRMVGILINDVQRFIASGERIVEFMKNEPQIKNAELPLKSDKIKGTIEFRNVGFCYGDEKVLEQINFKAYPGQKVAIIGPTGSGKSTLASLICRFNDCTQGELFIDGINIKDMDIKRLRENIGVAMQDVFLFSDTIEGNIAFGVPDASIHDIQWAAEAACADRFINSFPEGYDTIIGERGVGLSGGQKQRIALARALLKNPSILILDDTTSSVDFETEHRIQKTLNSIYSDKTTFIIAHRISSVKNADLIMVIDDGRIIEKGTHTQLLANKGYYRSVFFNQLGDFDSKLHNNPEGALDKLA